jgi:signal peptidase I
MRPRNLLAAIALALLTCAGCGGSGDSQQSDDQTADVSVDQTADTSAIEPRRIPSQAMTPTYRLGQRVGVDMSAYDNAHPQPGDVILYHPPATAVEQYATIEALRGACGTKPEKGQPCSKPAGGPAADEFFGRVVAVPGDELKVQDGAAVVNGESEQGEYLRFCDDDACELPVSITIPGALYFVMGDNRAEASDSRFWGPVKENWIEGQVAE